MARRHSLRDDQWERIRNLLPGREGTVGVTAKDVHRASGARIPDPDEPVHAGAGHQPAVGAPGDGRHGRRVAGEQVTRIARREGPDADGLVGASRDQLGPVRAEGQIGDGDVVESPRQLGVGHLGVLPFRRVDDESIADTDRTCRALNIMALVLSSAERSAGASERPWAPARMALVEAVMTMRPWRRCIICGVTARQVKATPLTLTSST